MEATFGPEAEHSEDVEDLDLPPAVPAFKAHFSHPHYDDQGDDLAPFGSDEASDFFWGDWSSRLDEVCPKTTLAWVLEDSGFPGDSREYEPFKGFDDAELLLTAGFIVLRYSGQIDPAGKALMLKAVDAVLDEFPDAPQLLQQRHDLENWKPSVSASS